MTVPSSSDRQRSVVIALAVVLALLAAAGLAVLLLRDTGDDRLAQPTPAPASPSPTASPTPSASTPAPAPPTEAPTAPADEGWPVDAAFLTPEAASAAEQPGWQVEETDGEPGPLLDPCAEGGFPLADAVEASDERVMTSEREPGGSGLGQEVFRYAGEQDAAAALSSYLDRVERCPRAPVEQDDAELERTVVRDASGEDRLLVRERYCNPACTDLYTTYVLVVRAADGLSVLRYSIGEDGDPEQGARALLDAAAEALRSAVRG